LTITVSRILFGDRNVAERKLIMKWCEEAAENGGSFSIDEEYRSNQWYQIFTINWPEE
jgi:hypothetical protein